MLKALIRFSVCVCLGGALWAAEAAAQEEADPNAPIVERVDVVGNQFLDKETFLFYISPSRATATTTSG